MPYTLAALETGALSEWRATLIVKQSACLSVHDRGRLDAELCGDPTRLTGWGNNRIDAEAKKIAARLDVAAVVARTAKAPADRCVTIRPAPDTMTYVTALLPVAQGVALYAALRRAADTTVDDRSRGQIMADTLYERITGKASADPVPVALNLVMADTTLAGDDDHPAWLHGFGPIPAGFAAGWIADAATTAQVRSTLRRLYRHPSSGQLVARESTARAFPAGLALLIGLRDQTCRTPYCDAPIRHHDHAVPHHAGGPTTATNGLGLCEAGNYTKEAPGWTVTTTEVDGTHVAKFVTPTGATYHSTAPPPPRPHISRIEHHLTLDLAFRREAAHDTEPDAA